MKAAKIAEIMNRWSKPTLIDTWDNTGFQIGDGNKEIKKILLALDVDRPIVDKAIQEGFDMIITHHPLIFKAVTEITRDSYKGSMILDLIQNDIVVYNAHSNLDLAKGGVNDALAEKLKVNYVKDLNVVYDDEEHNYGYGRIGTIRKTKLDKYIEFIKKALDVDFIKVYGEVDRTISKVAVCGGSGSSFIEDAYKMGAEVFITGDIKYHDAQLGHELGMTIIDPGHYETEKVVLPVVKKYLEEEIKGDIEIQVVMESSLPKQVY